MQIGVPCSMPPGRQDQAGGTQAARWLRRPREAQPAASHAPPLSHPSRVRGHSVCLTRGMRSRGLRATACDRGLQLCREWRREGLPSALPRASVSPLSLGLTSGFLRAHRCSAPHVSASSRKSVCSYTQYNLVAKVFFSKSLI